MDSIILDVPQILQNPELPNGCEVTSLAEVLNFWGISADKLDLADNYLPRSLKWFGADPNVVYMGNPHIEEECAECGYYCFAGPIVECARKYIEANGLGGKFLVKDLTGSEPHELYEHVKNGIPVIFWASLHFDDIKHDDCFFSLENGEIHHVFHELHCMVLKGITNDSVKIADPLGFNEEVMKIDFEKVYKQLGSRAVVILRTDS